MQDDIIDGPENGYAPKYDLPDYSSDIRLHYIIAAVPRTGSTLISHKLWATGCLGAPLEYLNFHPDSHYPNLRGDPTRQDSHWANTLRSRVTSNGVFGHKVFLPFLAELRRDNPTLLARIRPHKILYLTRADRTAQARSYARASATGMWVAQKTPGSIQYEPSANEMAVAFQWINRQEAAWEQVFEQLGISPLRLTYEQFVTDPAAGVSGIARYLKVDLDPAAALIVPNIQKMF